MLGDVADRLLRCHRDGENRRGIGILFLDRRLQDGARQLREDAVDTVAHFLRGDVGVLLEVERDDDLRDAFSGIRIELIDAADRVDRFLDLVGDTRSRACSGAAPGRRVVTVTVGKSTCGRRSMPSWPKAKAPTTTNDRIRTDAKTGRRTQSSASHCMTHLLRGDADAVGQLRDVARRDLFAGLQPTGELDEIADLLTDRDNPFFGLVARDDEHSRRAGNRAPAAAGVSTQDCDSPARSARWRTSQA